MPEKPFTIATYAAGASLAAITLVYVFGPTFFLDEGQSSSSRKASVVGLTNRANDCFINSILQALAGLGDLRLYLIRETHRRELDGPDVYRIRRTGSGHDLDRRLQDTVDSHQYRSLEKKVPHAEKLKTLEGLQRGLVTQALKEVLDRLNERPIYRKTISAEDFVFTLERAFGARISRQQQDAQEFLQYVTERLSEEYHAGRRARRLAARLQRNAGSLLSDERKSEPSPKMNGANVDKHAEPQLPTEQVERSWVNVQHEQEEDMDDDEDSGAADGEEGFPFEGTVESQISCSHCGFKPKPSSSTFVTMTLHVPLKSSTTLSSCFDTVFRVEHIDDFRCDLCRLEHALGLKEQDLARTTDNEKRMILTADIAAIKQAIETDPEKPPPNVQLPPLSDAPQRRISKHTRISRFPRLLAVHLSRSIYNTMSLSTKNMAKVSFPERLPLGGLLPSDRRSYRLRALVTHKGGHNSGHYESFRRQRRDGGGGRSASGPYSTPASFGREGAYSPRNSAQVTRPRDIVARLRGEMATSSTSDSTTNTESTLSPPTMHGRARDLQSASSSSASPDSFDSSRSSSLYALDSSSSSAKQPLPPPRSYPTSYTPDQQSNESEAGLTSNSNAFTALPQAASRQPPVAAASSSSSIKKANENISSSSASIARRFSRRSLTAAAGAMTGTPSSGATGDVASGEKKKECNRWWRISDEKIREAKTGEVLGMQKEVYLLFYEREDEDV